MSVDLVLLDQLYRARLVELRNRAEEAGFTKNGSVEVVRARLIQHQVLADYDFSWDGIQAMSHQELGETLKVFGIKSSGSHKERRQRLWLCHRAKVKFNSISKISIHQDEFDWYFEA